MATLFRCYLGIVVKTTIYRCAGPNVANLYALDYGTGGRLIGGS
jgi:hypothetical protein